jgi:hypothetical protein
VFREQGEQLSICLKELDRALGQSQPLTTIDCQQLFELCRKCSEGVWNQTQKQPRRRGNL